MTVSTNLTHRLQIEHFRRQKLFQAQAYNECTKASMPVSARL